jgi:hypothetical protein
LAPGVSRRAGSHISAHVTHYVVLALTVIGVSLLLAGWFRCHAIDQSQEWTRKLPYADVDSIKPLFVAGEGLSAEETRLAAQAQQIRARANLHLRVMNYFYSRYFASITLAMVLAIGAAACLLEITAVGWQSTNRYVRTLFLASASMAILFRVSPVLYKQKDNIAANKDLYTRYVMLDNELQSFVASKRFRGSDSTKVAAVIESLDSALFSLRELPIGFDESQIPDYLKIKFTDTQ